MPVNTTVNVTKVIQKLFAMKVYHSHDFEQSL